VFDCRKIWYTDHRTLFIAPFAHTALHGVFKDFLKAIFAKTPRSSKAAAGAAAAGLGGSSLTRVTGRKRSAAHVSPAASGVCAAAAATGGRDERCDDALPSTKQPRKGGSSSLVLPQSKLVQHGMRRVMAERAAGVVPHPGYGRQYRDVVAYHRSWTIEDSINAITTVLGAIFAPVQQDGNMVQVMDPLVKKAYGHLRRYIMFHLLVPPAWDSELPAEQQKGYKTHQDLCQAADEAHQELLEFGKLIQEVRWPKWQRAASTDSAKDCVLVKCSSLWMTS
jgi:hypothetical protein